MANPELTMTDKASDFLTYLQLLEFSSTDSRCRDPSSLADIQRNIYLHLKRSTWLTASSSSSRTLDTPSHWMREADKYLDRYTKIADKMDGDGLNNFAEGSLALCKYYKNESADWQTSLKVDKVLEIAQCQPSDSKVDPVDVPEDFILHLQTEPTTDGVIPVFEKDLSTSNIQTSPPTEEPGFKLLSSNQQAPALPFGNSVGPKPNPNIGPLNSSSSSSSSSLFTSGLSHQYSSNTRSVVSPDCFNTYLNQPNTANRMDAATGHLRNVPGNQAPTCSYQPSAQQTSSDLFSNSSKVEQMSETTHRANRKRNGNRLPVNEEQDNDVDEDSRRNSFSFRTAKEQMVINQQKKFGGGGNLYANNNNDRSQVLGASYGGGKKSLGTRRGPLSKFVPPVLNRDSYENGSPDARNVNSNQRHSDAAKDMDEPVDERLKGIEPKMIEQINNEIMDHGTPVLWTDIAGLEFAKKTIKEIVVWPMLRPDIFTGLRGPPKGLLLFGPPGTGKTLIGKCIASQSKSTFFCISASSLTSKWVGEGEKMVRALFAVARCHQPAVIFIDEIDSLLTQRSDAEHESSRRIKTEFLVQLDGAATNSDDRILVIGATNRPQEIDEAARRRFVKRLLIPLPEAVARSQIIRNLMSQQNARLTEEDIRAIVDRTDGYSGADMTNLCREAALGPIRSIPFEMMETVSPDQVRPIMFEDFEEALLQVRASVSTKDLQLYTDWNQTYGSFGQTVSRNSLVHLSKVD